MIFDTHTHYDDPGFDTDRDQLLKSLHQHNIGPVVNIGASIETSKKTLALMEQYSWMYGAIGVHPSESQELNEELLQWLKDMAGRERVVAIGEIGLDYYWDKPDREIQKKWFIKQLQLAREVSLPVVIHSRDAAKETLDLMKSMNADQIGGVIHCFSYSVELAKEYLKMGFYLGIGGVLTFKNAKKLKEVVQQVPIENLVLETDCPYLAPVPCRGDRNSSLNLPFVIEEIARLKNISEQEVIEITNRNARLLYHLDQ